MECVSKWCFETHFMSFKVVFDRDSGGTFKKMNKKKNNNSVER
jgi:hypothetical protein